MIGSLTRTLAALSAPPLLLLAVLACGGEREAPASSAPAAEAESAASPGPSAVEESGTGPALEEEAAAAEPDPGPAPAGTAVESRTAPREVGLSKGAFNPSAGDSVELRYRLASPQRVTVRVYDPDLGLVRTLADAAPRDAGEHRDAWDGRDDGGRTVPDEAYLFTIETASGGVFDPTTFSGGEVDDVTSARYDAEAGTFLYRLPAPARVLVRLGIESGPMLKTLVDWKPRVAGSITEYWDGRDEDGVFNLLDHPGYRALVTYVTLPEATVIAFGNPKESYRDYKLGRGADQPRKPERPRRAGPEVRLRPRGLVPPAWARAPRVLLSLPEAAATDVEPPLLGKAATVRIDVDPADRDQLLAEQFEIIFFVDGVFFAEAERGYLPFNWRWELHQLTPGEHVLTVNVSSFKGQVGVASRRVRVAGPG